MLTSTILTNLKEVADITVSTVAGTGIPDNDDGIGIAACFYAPVGVAVDTDGNIFVADTLNNIIRKITPLAVVSTFAGSGIPGGVDGIGRAASFFQPRGIAVYPDGSLFVADCYNNKIRKITPDGVVTTFAGTGLQGCIDGKGKIASFYLPNGIAADADGNIFVADTFNNKIRKITPDGDVKSFAGSNKSGHTDGIGELATFDHPHDIAIDSAGNLFVADWNNHSIRKITPLGVVSTIAGNGNEGHCDGAGTIASFRQPTGITVDSGGNLYIADYSNHKIRKITPNGVVTSFAGSGSSGNFDGAAANASFDHPCGIAIDSNGDLFVSDFHNNKIRKITNKSNSSNHDLTIEGLLALPNARVWTFAGTGIPDGNDGDRMSASFYGPNGIAIDDAGTIFVADMYNNKIRKITPDGIVTTFAGTGSPGKVDGTGNAASFNHPHGIAIGLHGEVFVTDYSNHTIRKISHDGMVTTIAGTGNPGKIDDIGVFASFNHPKGIAIDSVGNLFVADTFNNIIRKVSVNMDVTTFAGGCVIGDNSDGIGTGASFNNPQGIAIDQAGNLFITDTYSNKIRKITPQGYVTTIAGTGIAGGSDGRVETATFDHPKGIAIDLLGTIFITDYNNHTIRKISPEGVVTTVAGTGRRGNSDGIGVSAGFSTPFGIAVDRNGNLIVADTANHKIRQIILSDIA